MRTVHKFSVVRIGEPFEILTGKTFKPLTMQVQNGLLCVWAEVETSEEQNVKHQLVVVGTGHFVPPCFEWVATCQDGSRVWHLYA
jgi:hypothetical protein